MQKKPQVRTWKWACAAPQHGGMCAAWEVRFAPGRPRKRSPAGHGRSFRRGNAALSALRRPSSARPPAATTGTRSLHSPPCSRRPRHARLPPSPRARSPTAIQASNLRAAAAFQSAMSSAHLSERDCAKWGRTPVWSLNELQAARSWSLSIKLMSRQQVPQWMRLPQRSRSCAWRLPDLEHRAAPAWEQSVPRGPHAILLKSSFWDTLYSSGLTPGGK